MIQLYKIEVPRGQLRERLLLVGGGFGGRLVDSCSRRSKMHCFGNIGRAEARSRISTRTWLTLVRLETSLLNVAPRP